MSLGNGNAEEEDDLSLEREAVMAAMIPRWLGKPLTEFAADEQAQIRATWDKLWGDYCVNDAILDSYIGCYHYVLPIRRAFIRRTLRKNKLFDETQIKAIMASLNTSRLVRRKRRPARA